MFRFFKFLLIFLFTFLSALTVSLPAEGAPHHGTPPEAADAGIWNPEALEKWSHMKDGVLNQCNRLEQFIFDEEAPPWQRKAMQWLLLLHGVWLLWILYMRLVLWMEKQRAWQNLDLPLGFPGYRQASRSGCSDFLYPLQNQLDWLGYNDTNLNEVRFTEKMAIGCLLLNPFATQEPPRPDGAGYSADECHREQSQSGTGACRYRRPGDTPFAHYDGYTWLFPAGAALAAGLVLL